MATQTASTAHVFEQVFENLRKAAEANLEMQQELFRKWNSNWPGFPQPQADWQDRIQKFQKAWAKTMKEVLTRHREVLDEQYGLALSSLEEAFRVAQSSDPQDFVKRCESLCRKGLEMMRETGELQAKELQEALGKWTELVGKSTA
jgi:hypothetical protein